MTTTLATWEDLQALLGEDIPINRQTGAIVCLEMATGAVQAFMGQTLTLVEDDVVELPGEWGSELWLPERPVLAVSDVMIVDKPGAMERALVFATDYGWMRSGRFEALSSFWGGPSSIVTVTYTHGYAVGALPDPNPLRVTRLPEPFRDVCLTAAARLYTNPDQVSNEGLDGFVAGRKAELLTDAEKKLLRPLRPVRRTASVSGV